MGSLCRKAGVKPFSFHALRHYGASTLAAKGAPLADIEAILGHEFLTTTSYMFKVYRQAREKQLRFWMRIKDPYRLKMLFPGFLRFVPDGFPYKLQKLPAFPSGFF